MILGHVIVQTGFLHESLAADGTHFPPVPRVNPLVEIQRRLPKERLSAELAVVILDRPMFKLMLVQTFETEGLVVAKITLVLLTEHVEVVDMFTQLNFSVESAFACVTFESVVDVVLLKLVDCEWSLRHELFRAVLAHKAGYLVVFGFNVEA